MKKLICMILAALMLVGTVVSVSAADASTFSDVKTSRWSYEAIKYAVGKGYMNGIGDGKFDPAGSMTRGMVVTVLYRREGSPEVTFRNDFTDVKAGKYYSDAVIWAKDEGVVNGITETTFEPNGKITREQLATMLSRFSERCLVSVPERADLSGYPDHDKIHNYAKDAMAWANEANLIKGMSDGTLSPRGYATREQFATILQRFDDTFTLAYNEPALRSHYTEPEYPLVDDADVYVATDGNDSNPGTFEKPLATFNRAVEKVREIKQTKKEGDIIVAFKAGDYGPLSVTLTAEDTGTPEQRIVYCAYGDGDVVFNNGREILESDFVPLSDEEKYLFSDKAVDQITKTSIKDIIDDYTLKTTIFTLDGVLTVARFPNKYSDGTDNLLKGGYTSDDRHIRLTAGVFKNRAKKYHTLKGLNLYGYLTTGWFKDTLEVSDINFETGDFEIADPTKAVMGSLRYNEFPSDIYNAVAMTNISEELDQPGEYWVDQETMTLYAYDQHGDLSIPGGNSVMISLRQADFITFKGLTVKNSKEMLFSARNSHDLTVDLCDFSCCGTKGDNSMEVISDLPGRDLNFFMTRSSVDRVSCYCLYVRGGVGPYGNSNCRIDNNRFSHSHLMVDRNGALYITGDRNVVTHNEFVDIGRSAIVFGGCFDVIEYNDFNHCMFNSSDGGVIYYGRNVRNRSNVIRYNLFRNVPAGAAYGAYSDDGNGGTEISNNLFFDVVTAVAINGGRDNPVLNNVFVNPSGNPALIGIGGGPNMLMSESEILSADLSDDLDIWVSFYDQCERDEVYKEYYMEHWPFLFEYTMDVARHNDWSWVLNPANDITGNMYISNGGTVPDDYGWTVKKYSVIENNIGYTLKENPIFVNPAIGDYRIRDGAGFPDIEFEKIGRY